MLISLIFKLICVQSFITQELISQIYIAFSNRIFAKCKASCRCLFLLICVLLLCSLEDISLPKDNLLHNVSGSCGSTKLMILKWRELVKNCCRLIRCDFFTQFQQCLAVRNCVSLMKLVIFRNPIFFGSILKLGVSQSQLYVITYRYSYCCNLLLLFRFFLESEFCDSYTPHSPSYFRSSKFSILV